jgi:hypothetical protein
MPENAPPVVFGSVDKTVVVGLNEDLPFDSIQINIVKTTRENRKLRESGQIV